MQTTIDNNVINTEQNLASMRMNSKIYEKDTTTVISAEDARALTANYALMFNMTFTDIVCAAQCGKSSIVVDWSHIDRAAIDEFVKYLKSAGYNVYTPGNDKYPWKYIISWRKKPETADTTELEEALVEEA